MFKNLLFFCSIFLTLSTYSFSQSNYTFRISNSHLIDDYTFQFDVDASAHNPLEITSYQCVFSLFCNSINNDNYSFSFLDGSSQLKNKPTLGVSAKLISGKVQLTFASIAGNDTIKNNLVRIGSFKVKRNKKFDFSEISIIWNFSGDNITILTGHLFTDITDSSNFFSDKNLTAVNEKKVIPSDYSLYQNFPNPFNPLTKIIFYQKEEGKVKLEVFNILGEKVADLINEELSSGFHEVNFNAGELASGIYFYKLNVENKFFSVKKMILQK